MRVKISRKESKESRYWLQLVECANPEDNERERLSQEATELMKIFGAIIQKSEARSTKL
jgi:four helix bundle protein